MCCMYLWVCSGIGELFISPMRSATNSWPFQGLNFKQYRMVWMIFSCCLPNLARCWHKQCTVWHCKQHLWPFLSIFFVKKIPLHFLSPIQDAIYLRQPCGLVEDIRTQILLLQKSESVTHWLLSFNSLEGWVILYWSWPQENKPTLLFMYFLPEKSFY
jgi:hypothetical protein